MGESVRVHFKHVPFLCVIVSCPMFGRVQTFDKLELESQPTVYAILMRSVTDTMEANMPK